MIELGFAVVPATDLDPGSSPTASMPMALSLPCTQMKMSPAGAITAAMVNAAHSRGRGGEMGAAEPGMQADLATHDCDDCREPGCFFGRETAAAVYLAGRGSIREEGIRGERFHG
jgi:imidazolonepropionase